MHKDGYDNEIKDCLDKLNPTNEQSKAMWVRLEKAIADKEVENNDTKSEESKVVSTGFII